MTSHVSEILYRVRYAHYAVLLATIFCLPFGKDKNSAITQEEFQVVLEKKTPIQIIDVRTESEFKSGHIANSVNVPISEIEKNSDTAKQILGLEKNMNTVIVCSAGGMRSQSGQKLLAEKGFQNVRYLEGGVLAFQKKQ